MERAKREEFLRGAIGLLSTMVFFAALLYGCSMLRLSENATKEETKSSLCSDLRSTQGAAQTALYWAKYFGVSSEELAKAQLLLDAASSAVEGACKDVQ